MEFSDLYKQTGSICAFSPDGSLLATVVDLAIVVRDAETLKIAHLFKATERIQQVLWSPDSRYLLCASLRAATLQIWGLDADARDEMTADDVAAADKDKPPRRFLTSRGAAESTVGTPRRRKPWSCVIDEGLAGLTACEWAPDGRHVLTFSDYALRITVWSLLDGSARVIQYPKPVGAGGRAHAWRRDGRYLAVASRSDCRDHVSVYEAAGWTLARHFAVGTQDLQDVRWSPDGRFLAVHDGALHYRAAVYYPNGRLVAAYAPADDPASGPNPNPSPGPALGVRVMRWAPSAQFLAVGGYDGVVRLLNHYTWQPLAEWRPQPQLDDAAVAVFSLDRATAATAAPQPLRVDAAERHRIATVQPASIAGAPGPPRAGIGMLEFDCTGRLVVARSDTMPQCLWLYDVLSLRQTALVELRHPVRQVAWNPVRPGVLAFVSTPTLAPGGVRNAAEPSAEAPLVSWVYLWRGRPQPGDGPDGDPDPIISTCEAVPVPAADFQLHRICWNPRGTALLLYDREKFCVSFFI